MAETRHGKDSLFRALYLLLRDDYGRAEVCNGGCAVRSAARECDSCLCGLSETDILAHTHGCFLSLPNKLFVRRGGCGRRNSDWGDNCLLFVATICDRRVALVFGDACACLGHSSGRGASASRP